jgi:hypothetical protein
MRRRHCRPKPPSRRPRIWRGQKSKRPIGIGGDGGGGIAVAGIGGDGGGGGGIAVAGIGGAATGAAATGDGVRAGVDAM